MAITFDLETTGVGPDCRIIQFAFKDGDKVFTGLVNPEIPIEPGAIDVHGITDEAVSTQPTMRDYGQKILDFITSDEIVLSGYNIRKFDVAVLRRELRRVGLTLPKVKIIDVFEINKKLNPYSLARCYEMYAGKSMDEDKAHDALYDVECTIKALQGIVKKHKLENEDLTKFAEPEHLAVCDSSWFIFKDMDVVISKGKHADTPLLKLASKNSGYVTWMLKLDDLDYSTRMMLNYAIEGKAQDFFSMLKEWHPDRPEVGYVMAKYYLLHKYSDKVLERAIEIAKTSVSHAFLAFYYAYNNGHPSWKDLLELYQSEEDSTAQAEDRKKFIKGLEL